MRMKKLERTILIILKTGDLSRRKLLPALFRLENLDSSLMDSES